jgi:nucleotide-binding universal stress UspA family protein
VGRTGISRLKYLIFGSIAQKLTERVRHIPTVIVGGSLKSRTILIALDDSMEAMRGVSSVAALAGPSDPRIILCGCLDPAGIAGDKGAVRLAANGETGWIQRHSDRFNPLMDEASRRLAAGGVSKGNISRQFVRINGNAIGSIIEAFTAGCFGTIVVGHRDAIGFTHEQLRGRFSEKIIRSLDHMAVWVAS